MNSSRWLWGLLHFKLSAQSIKKNINIYGYTRKKAYVNIYVCLYIHGSEIKRNGTYFKIEETVAESQKVRYKEKHKLYCPITLHQHVSGTGRNLRKALDLDVL